MASSPGEPAQSFLDAMVAMMSDFVSKEWVDVETAEVIFQYVQMAFDRARDRRPFGEEPFLARCKALLPIMTKVRSRLRGHALADLEALEGVILELVRKRNRKR